NSVLTSVGERHMRQRKLLLAPFHGEAVERYVQMITEVAEREIDGWQIGARFALAPRMQAVTRAVIMGGIFGIEGTPARGSEERQALCDEEVGEELLTVRLAGHETTANSLAWTFERLLRTPAAYARLRETVRAGGEDADDYIEATIHEGMRVRPVIPMIVRMA